MGVSRLIWALRARWPNSWRRMDSGRVIHDQALVGTVAGEIDVLTLAEHHHRR